MMCVSLCGDKALRRWVYLCDLRAICAIHCAESSLLDLKQTMRLRERL